MGFKDEVPDDDDFTIPIGKADIKRAGTDVTIVALAWLVHEALAAAETLAKEGISVEVVDPRTLVPMDHETIRASVQKTGRCVDCRRGRADMRRVGRDRGARDRGSGDVHARSRRRSSACAPWRCRSPTAPYSKTMFSPTATALRQASGKC